jgi:O-antigen ligase
VGFFANRNHFAALLYTTLIFASVLLTISAGNFVARGTLSSRSILWFILSGILIVSILVGIAIARSRAGVILSAVALVGIVIMIFAGKQRGDKSRRAMQNSVSRLTTVMILLAIVFAAQFGVHRVMSRFDADPLQDLRFALSPATFKIAIEYLPLGSGLGSFMEVYANHEKTENLFNGYANRAHNDWAEIFLETGILGAAAIGLFLTWFGIRAFQIIRLRAKPGEENYLLLQRGAVLVIPLIMAHSLVDYPLRTTAVSVIFTCACALLVDHSKFSNKFT